MSNTLLQIIAWLYTLAVPAISWHYYRTLEVLWTFGGIGALLLVFANLGRIRNFTLDTKGLDVAVQEAQEVTREARATLRDLEKVTLTVSRLGALSLANTGQMIGATFEDRLDSKQQLVALLRDELNFPPDEIAAVVLPLDRNILNRYRQQVEDRARDAFLDQNGKPDFSWSHALRDIKRREDATPETELKALLRERNVPIDEELSTILRCYDKFRVTGELAEDVRFLEHGLKGLKRPSSQTNT